MVIKGLAEESNGIIESRQQHDEDRVSSLMNEISVENVSFTDLWRIGCLKPNGSRLIKIRDLNVGKKHEILRKSKVLKDSTAFKNAHINTDMTPIKQ